MKQIIETAEIKIMEDVQTEYIKQRFVLELTNKTDIPPAKLTHTQKHKLSILEIIKGPSI